MLLNPRRAYDYNGYELTYPDIKLIYWADGNPFHHHQDLNRLRKAWQRPDTVIVNESVWTATARHADIVFPCTTSLERNDLGGSSHDDFITPMHRLEQPYEGARDDYEIFASIAEHLNLADKFTDGKTADDWIREIYETTQSNAQNSGISPPSFEKFWEEGQFCLTDQLEEMEFPLEKFRPNPQQFPLGTSSGRIEIYSEKIASFQYDDCKAHACWFEKQERLGADLADRFPMHLISNQPRTRLHSQLDFGRISKKRKIKERERARMNPIDAEARGISSGDVILVKNDRGSCLADVEISDSVREEVIELPTGAWFDPKTPENDGSIEVHGNPNVLTRDSGTSKLAQGPIAQSCLVEVERYDQPLPPVKAFRLPEFAD